MRSAVKQPLDFMWGYKLDNRRFCLLINNFLISSKKKVSWQKKWITNPTNLTELILQSFSTKLFPPSHLLVSFLFVFYLDVWHTCPVWPPTLPWWHHDDIIRGSLGLDEDPQETRATSSETGCRKNEWNVPLINEQEWERRRSIEHSNTHRRIYTLEFWSQRRERIRTAPGLGLSFSSSSPRLLSSSSALFTSLCSLFSSLLVTRYFNISYFNHFNFNLVFSGGLAWIEISVLSRARVHLIGLVRNETFITCQQKLAVWFSQRAPRHHADQRYRCFERSEGERRDWST